MKRILLFALLLPCLVLAQSSPYDEWLQNEGYYLLSPQQKEKFRALPDFEKEVYIRNLWASLDPDPLTPENEFQTEYEKRFQYTKKHYPIPSDRAKVYLLLGAPNSVESYPNSDKYYPLELWSYYSLGYRGLPPSLDLIFFKRWGAGDYRLYSPLFDGMKALTPSSIDLENPRMQSQKKALFDADVVQAAQHISTGAGEIESEEVRAALQDPAAVEKILQKQRPSVETTVVYQGFDASVYAYSVPYEGQISRTSITIAVLPKYMTFEKSDTEYRSRVDLIGKITDDQGREILKINDSPALKMSEADIEKAKSYLFSYSFDAYLLPGKYNLECIYRDYASNAAGKLEKSFEVEPVSGDLDLLPPLLAYKSVPATVEQMPFEYEWQQYYPKENSTFNNGQPLVLYTSLLNPQKKKLQGLWKLQLALKQEGQDALDVEENLPIDSSTDVSLVRKIRLQSLIPGSYFLSIRLSQGSTTYTADAPIKIGSDPEVLGRMRVIPTSSFTQESYHTNLALQYYNRKELDEAAKHVRIALDFAPSSYAARSLSARIEKAKGNSDTAITAYEKLVQESPADSEGFFLIGKWSMEKKDLAKAADMFKKAMALGYYTTELLNGLAEVQVQLGNTNEAIDYWQKSLALNSNQPDIQKQLSTYKR